METILIWFWFCFCFCCGYTAERCMWIVQLPEFFLGNDLLLHPRVLSVSKIMVLCWVFGCCHDNEKDCCKFYGFPINLKEKKMDKVDKVLKKQL
ncbi:hypothetical protein QTP88_004737 [Uroleucon formosanum]